MRKCLEALDVNIELLSIKIMHGRIPVDFLKSLLIYFSNRMWLNMI